MKKVRNITLGEIFENCNKHLGLCGDCPFATNEICKIGARIQNIFNKQKELLDMEVEL